MNKKLTRILLVAVVLIWAAVIYQIIPSKESNSIISKDVSINSNIKKSKNIKLSYNYNDPFLNNAYIGNKSFISEKSIVIAEVNNSIKNSNSIKNFTSTENISNQNTLPKVNIIVWPSIKYAGKVNKRGLFMIGTSKVIVQPKEIYQDIKFISIAPDSSIVEYKGEKKVFKKQ